MSLRTDLFLDTFGGLPNNEAILLFGLAGSGKTLLASFLALKFLEQYSFSYVIYVDADKKSHLINFNQLAKANNIPLISISRILVFMNPDPKIILDDIKEFIENNSPDALFIVIDSLASIIPAHSEKNAFDTDLKIHSIPNFIQALKNLTTHIDELYLVIIDQVRSLITKKKNPSFWLDLGYIPAYWNYIHPYIDTALLLKKIHRRNLLLRVIFSNTLPEITGIIRINKNLKIM